MSAVYVRSSLRFMAISSKPLVSLNNHGPANSMYDFFVVEFGAYTYGSIIDRTHAYGIVG